MPLHNLPIKTGQLFIGLAVFMGVLTMVMLGGQKPKAPKATTVVETQAIVVPLSSISEGQTLTLNDIKSVKWPKAYLPKGEFFSDPYELTGRVAKQNLYPGEPIYKDKVSGSNTGGGLPALIPNGHRAVTVAVSEVKGVAGFVKPGDRVDVISTFDLSKDDQEVQMTKIVLQNVLVLASAQSMVDESGRKNMDAPDGVLRGEATSQVAEENPKDKKKDKDKEKPKTDAQIEKEKQARKKEKDEAEKKARLVSSVTLAVTPEQSEALALAEETGELRLALRPENDHKITNISGVDFSQLLGGRGNGKMPPVPPIPTAGAPRYGNSVELIQGTEKSSVDFQLP